MKGRTASTPEKKFKSKKNEDRNSPSPYNGSSEYEDKPYKEIKNKKKKKKKVSRSRSRSSSSNPKPVNKAHKKKKSKKQSNHEESRPEKESSPKKGLVVQQEQEREREPVEKIETEMQNPNRMMHTAFPMMKPGGMMGHPGMMGFDMTKGMMPHPHHMNFPPYFMPPGFPMPPPHQPYMGGPPRGYFPPLPGPARVTTPFTQPIGVPEPKTLIEQLPPNPNPIMKQTFFPKKTNFPNPAFQKPVSQSSEIPARRPDSLQEIRKNPIPRVNNRKNTEEVSMFKSITSIPMISQIFTTVQVSTKMSDISLYYNIVKKMIGDLEKGTQDGKMKKMNKSLDRHLQQLAEIIKRDKVGKESSFKKRTSKSLDSKNWEDNERYNEIEVISFLHETNDLIQVYQKVNLERLNMEIEPKTINIGESEEGSNLFQECKDLFYGNSNARNN